MPIQVRRGMDTIYHFAGFRGSPSRCRLRVVKLGPDRPAVVVATEIPDNPGTSIASRAEALATNVAHEQQIDPDCLLWVEHCPPRGVLPESFKFVAFHHDRLKGRLMRPEWSRTTRAAVERLIGQALAD